jgi:predicted short-subunit dehydrogenase-like oxidoreductase (DUF2520 family)
MTGPPRRPTEPPRRPTEPPRRPTEPPRRPTEPPRRPTEPPRRPTEPPRRPTVAILGGGAVGQALSRSLPRAGVRVGLRWNRSALRPGFGARGTWTTSLPPLTDFELVLLAVKDAAVEPLCRTLRVSRRQLVVHLSGALTLSALASARAQGAAVGSLHPLRAIVRGDRSPFRGAAAGIAGSSPSARKKLAMLARALGMAPLAIPDQARPLYHAAATLAAGGAVALFAEAASAFRAATGASEAEARAALLPLALGALGKLRELPPERALTGPIARGDVATVRAHRSALSRDMRPLYDQLARSALRLSRDGSRAPPQALDELEAALRLRARE